MRTDDEHHVILAFPYAVFETLIRLHVLCPFVNSERFTMDSLQTDSRSCQTSGVVQQSWRISFGLTVFVTWWRAASKGRSLHYEPRLTPVTGQTATFGTSCW